MNKEQNTKDKDKSLDIIGFSHCEYFTVTNKIRYKKKEIDLGNGTSNTEYRLQQMWQGSGGSQDWHWVEYVD